MAAFQRLPDIQSRYKYCIRKPCYYANQGLFVFATFFGRIKELELRGGQFGIYTFDISKNRLNLVHINKMEVKHYYGFWKKSNQFIIGDNFFMFFGDSTVFGRFNLINQSMHYCETNPYEHPAVCNSEPLEIAHLDSPNEPIHIFDLFNHRSMRYNKPDDSITITPLIDGGEFPDKVAPEFKIIYVPFTRNFFYFEYNDEDDSYYGKMFYCDWSENQTKFDWKQHPLKMPPCSDDCGLYGIVIAFGHLVFLFYAHRESDQRPIQVGENQIFCFDALTKELFKCEYNVPHFMVEGDIWGLPKVHVLKAKQNDVHILNFKRGHHVKVSLYDIIPQPLFSFYQKRYDPLVMRYVKQNEKNDIIPTIPMVLKQLICLYFPSFI